MDSFQLLQILWDNVSDDDDFLRKKLSGHICKLLNQIQKLALSYVYFQQDSLFSGVILFHNDFSDPNIKPVEISHSHFVDKL